jgi:branched-chain amino acid transport system ATP-binding protein
MTDAVLRVDQLNVRYRGPIVVHDVSLALSAGDIYGVLGPNGAGKTTLLRGVMGLISTPTGAVHGPGGVDLTKSKAMERARSGIAYVPEQSGIFVGMTVEENLVVAMRGIKRTERPSVLRGTFERWPVLEERRLQKAGTLSGGERKSLALARALVTRPSVMLLDEPSLGLSPIAIDRLFETIDRLCADGMACLVVEQNVGAVLSRAEHVMVLEGGRSVREGAGRELSLDDSIRQSYLGG